MIEKADAVLPVLSVASEKSHWMSSELSLAIAEQLTGRRLIIIPVLAERNATPPFFLRDLQWVDLSSEDRVETNIEALFHALQSGTETAPTQAAVLTNRGALIAIQERFLKAEIRMLQERQMFLTRKMYWHLATAALTFLGVLLALTLWKQLGGQFSLSFASALISFLFGVAITAFSSVLFLRHYSRRRENKEHSVTGGGDE
jgi:hypothetical protein